MTDNTLTWNETRTFGIKRFGNAPGPEIENEMIQAFQTAPLAFVETIYEVANLVDRGEATSGWGLTHARTRRLTQPVRDITVTKPDARAKAIDRAEQWLRVAGIHFDSQTEIEDELFGDRGQLKEWPDLRDRMVDMWIEIRPIGEQLEREDIQRGLDYQATHTCEDCGRVNPFHGRPCTCPQRRARIAEQADQPAEPEREPVAAGVDFWEGT